MKRVSMMGFNKQSNGAKLIMNFIEQCIKGETTVDKIDDWIDEWHDTPHLKEKLHEFLGMTWDEYIIWVVNPNTLQGIIDFHKDLIKETK